jgi:hypothetical protein
MALAIPLAISLTMVPVPDTAYADGCSSVTACQTEQQEALLAPLNTLLGTQAGQSVLSANLQSINAIYLNSTPGPEDRLGHGANPAGHSRQPSASRVPGQSELWL